MKRISLFGILLLLSLLMQPSLAGAEMARVKEYIVSPQVMDLELSTFHGSIRWFPPRNPEEARIFVEVLAGGPNEQAVRKLLTQVRIVENIDASSILLEARVPTIPPGVNHVVVNYDLYLPANRIRQLKAKTAQGTILIDVDFAGRLTLINSNGPIILQNGIGSINLSTENAPIEFGRWELTNSSVIENSNGSISGAVSFPEQGLFSFRTTNAPIDLQMPCDTPGIISLSALSGTVDFHLGDEIVNGISVATIHRSPSPKIEIKTSADCITVSEIPPPDVES